MMKKSSLPFLIFLMIFAHGIYLFKQNYFLGFSFTPSLPHSVFFVNKNDKKITKIDYVAFFYTGENIYAYKKNEPFVKIAKCLPNDTLTTTKDFTYYCNDKKIGKAYLKDSKGDDLTHFIFNGTVPKDKYFVVGTHPKSYDSKYWGFVESKKIIGKAKGLL